MIACASVGAHAAQQGLERERANPYRQPTE
jgi:hypothetical protein